MDSDCILPEGYLAAVESELQQQKADAFGGPDRAHDSFTNIQKAINYAMTSFFTTGGIRAVSYTHLGKCSKNCGVNKVVIKEKKLYVASEQGLFVVRNLEKDFKRPVIDLSLIHI